MMNQTAQGWMVSGDSHWEGNRQTDQAEVSVGNQIYGYQSNSQGGQNHVAPLVAPCYKYHATGNTEYVTHFHYIQYACICNLI